MHRRNTLLASFVSISLMVGCTWSPEANINGGGPGGNTGGGNHGGPGGTGVVVDAGGPTLDSNCGISTLTTMRLPPDLLLVFDKSGSMAEDPSTGHNCNPGGDLSVEVEPGDDGHQPGARGPTMTDNWGLKLFSDSGNCAVAAGAQVNIGANAAAAITTALGRTGPAGNTPTTLAVRRGGDYLATLTDNNPKFMVLVTDGAPTCANNNGNGADDADADRRGHDPAQPRLRNLRRRPRHAQATRRPT